ncbi:MULTISPECIES: hypothetical protein [Bacillus cereus group]|uniref:hypothetical protein n=1 Tax=Bacillus cereus group TaxID=86661 RepID=UPI000BF51C28|nr:MULTISPECIES: hypothetical protein [Bacillus cereus group]PHG10474.1 hypothetical protein COI66_08905 [Bacillus toyonensis]MCP9277393.1 hypothetical protein [Bacillus wiedmannii]PFJ55142.1 hypothetical protein COJ02_18155 [Bacillus thuringiensis]PFR42132.1 hypothetical protein COK27_11115 [Bacillus thuringiensis]PGL25069.1 hypothetical protein CN921_16635 [Bacillus thuringiensis]
MFSGLSIETISKFSPVIVALLGAATATFIYITNQFINVRTTNALDERFKDKSNQFKLKFWFYTIGILMWTSVYFIYSLLLYPGLHEYRNSFLFLLNAIICLSLFVYFLITLIPIKPLKELIKSKWHFNLLIFHMFTSILFFFSASSEYIVNEKYLAFLRNMPLVAFLFSLFYFFTLHKITTAKAAKYEYDIHPITEGTFKEVDNLKFDYQMDENRLVFYKELEPDDKIFYVYDSSSKLYMQCKKIVKTEITAEQPKTPKTRGTRITINIERNSN